MHLAPLGKSPGDAGWASFAKLLKWCPGWHGEREINKKWSAQETGYDSEVSSSMTEVQIAVEGHLDDCAEEVSKEFLSDPSKCRAAYVLCCTDHKDFEAEFGVSVSKIYRGFIVDVQAWAADCGIDLFGAERSARTAEKGSAGSEDGKAVCPFCPAPVQRLPEELFSLPEDTFLSESHDFLVCSTGQLHGLMSFDDTPDIFDYGRDSDSEDDLGEF
jgi:hypothetical protein